MRDMQGGASRQYSELDTSKIKKRERFEDAIRLDWAYQPRTGEMGYMILSEQVFLVSQCGGISTRFCPFGWGRLGGSGVTCVSWD